MTSNEPIKKKKKLEGGDTRNIQISGKHFLKQTYSSKEMAEFMEVLKKDTYIQNDIS